ncbi:proline-rich receptor-like protein kinase PERK1 [Arachis duranensis]|uniref:Proline-rich receptor-like protein kinase PERK1 n=1 Tax=Arachis duranensis TaxID=130453 RepID=A0A9C6TIT6_ARADU|nr:proline-rich receptor-like protein kinase PERK1 [Arachis duranensis]
MASAQHSPTHPRTQTASSHPPSSLLFPETRSRSHSSQQSPTHREDEDEDPVTHPPTGPPTSPPPSLRRHRLHQESLHPAAFLGTSPPPPRKPSSAYGAQAIYSGWFAL